MGSCLTLQGRRTRFSGNYSLRRQTDSAEDGQGANQRPPGTEVRWFQPVSGGDAECVVASAGYEGRERYNERARRMSTQSLPKATLHETAHVHAHIPPPTAVTLAG